MSCEIKLNFYDEIVVLNITNKDYKSFKAEIAKRYGIDPSDVNELIVYYFDTDKVKNFVKNEKDYITLAGNSKKFTVVVFLEIHEESRLFKEGQKINPFTNPNTGSVQSNVDKIRNEILEKELLLKKTIELEKLEMQKKKEETKKKMDEENKKKKLEELRAKKLKLEEEEEERKKREKIELESEVTKLMNEQMERLKKTLIDNTVNQSLQIVDKQMEKRFQLSQCKEVHSGFTCSGCGQTPIIGIRYTCGVVTDFSLCENCEMLIGDSHPYPLLKYRNSKQGNTKLKIIIEQPSNLKKVEQTNNKSTKDDKDDDCILFEDFNKIKK